jgi:hypothetical protein
VSTHRLGVGDQVDVHTNFSDSWVAGFEIAGLMADGYRVRRNSDGSLLPGSTSERDLRATPTQRPTRLP